MTERNKSRAAFLMWPLFHRRIGSLVPEKQALFILRYGGAFLQPGAMDPSGHS